MLQTARQRQSEAGSCLLLGPSRAVNWFALKMMELVAKFLLANCITLEDLCVNFQAITLRLHDGTA